LLDSRGMPNDPSETESWPELPLEAWQDTYVTLHRWMQVVGKIRLALSPMCNHWWQVPLYVAARGLTTSPIPYSAINFQIDFDFIDHQVRIETSKGARRAFDLSPISVADFHREIMAQLQSLGIEVAIWTVPVEVDDRTPFEHDHHHAAYDAGYSRRHWQILSQVNRVLRAFRGRFVGKVSPVHFF
jgi:hypothetical protein